MSYTFSSQHALIEAVRNEITEEFRRKGERLLPIDQEDIDGLLARIDARLKSGAMQAQQYAEESLTKAESTLSFLAQCQLPGIVLDTLTKSRSRSHAGGRHV